METTSLTESSDSRKKVVIINNLNLVIKQLQICEVLKTSQIKSRRLISQIRIKAQEILRLYLIYLLGHINNNRIHAVKFGLNIAQYLFIIGFCFH